MSLKNNNDDNANQMIEDWRKEIQDQIDKVREESNESVARFFQDEKEIVTTVQMMEIKNIYLNGLGQELNMNVETLRKTFKYSDSMSKMENVKKNFQTYLDFIRKR